MAIGTGYDYANDGSDRYGSSNDFLEAVEDFDNSNQALYNLVEEIANRDRLTETDPTALSHYTSQVAIAWGKVTQQLMNNVGLHGSEFANTVAAMWVQNEDERASAFNKSIPEANIGVVMDGNIASLSRQIYDSYQEALEEDEIDINSLAKEVTTELCRSYARSLQSDAQAAFNAIVATSLKQPDLDIEQPSGRRYLLSRIGKEALGAAKIAAGVAAGIIVGQWINRKR